MATETPAPLPTEADIVRSHREDAAEFFKSTDGVIRPDRLQTRAPAETPPVVPVTPVTETAEDFGASVFTKKAATPPTTPVTEEDPTKGLVEPEAGSKHRADWDKLKAAEAKARKQVAELEAKLKSASPAEADAATKARLAKFEAENKDLSDRLKIFDVQGHPDFQRDFVLPKQAALGAASEILKQEGVEADLVRLLSLKGKAFAEEASKISAKLTDFNKPAFVAELRRIQTLDAQAAATILNADSFREQKTKEFQSRTRGVYDEVAKVHANDFVPAVSAETATAEQKAYDEAWNAALVARNAAAERYAFAPANEHAVADVAQKAASYDLLVEHGIPRITRLAYSRISALQAELKAAKAELAGISVSQPAMGVTSVAGSEAPSMGELGHREAARMISFSR